MKLFEASQLWTMLLTACSIYAAFWALDAGAASLIIADLPLTIGYPSNNLPEKVCVLIPVTSHTQDWKSINDSFVYQFPLPSLARTYEPHRYLYSIYIGYDIGDPFFDNYDTLFSLYQRAKQTIPYANPILTPFANKLRKPGPVMNFLSNQAYNDGCDFLYHVNDDTELLTPSWTTKFIDALRNFTPPLLGVVGPTCRQGNTVVIAHDFVHRSHLDRFPTHYPPQLTDWWLDDWITWVYGEGHARMLDDVEVRRHELAARYEVCVFWGIRKLWLSSFETQVNWDSQLVLKELLAEGGV